MLRVTSLAGEPAAPEKQALPLEEAFRTDWRGLVRGFFLAVAPSAAFYTTFIDLPMYLQNVDGMSASVTLKLNTISMLIPALSSAVEP